MITTMALGFKRTRQRAALLLTIVLVSTYLLLSSSAKQQLSSRSRTFLETTSTHRQPAEANSFRHARSLPDESLPAVDQRSPGPVPPAAAPAGANAPQAHAHQALQFGEPALFLQQQNFSVTVVVAKQREDEIDWIKRDLPGVDVVLYTLEPVPVLPATPAAQHVADKQHPPRAFEQPPSRINQRGGSSTASSSSDLAARDTKEQTIRGIEVIAYLNYIVDHYDSLPDIVIFTHQAQRKPQHWEVIGEDLPATLKKLNGVLVWEEGYVNLYCDTRNNCPRWRSKQHEFVNDNELRDFQIFNAAWNSLYPGVPIPEEMGQPAGNQFAVSRDKIRYAKTRDEWAQYRDWVVDRAADLTGVQSSRVWEFMWQYVFKSKGMLCRKAAACYCDTYGVCLATDDTADEIRQKKDGQNRLLERYHSARAQGKDSKEWANSIDRLRREMVIMMKKGSIPTDRRLEIVGSKPPEKTLPVGKTSGKSRKNGGGKASRRDLDY